MEAVALTAEDLIVYWELVARVTTSDSVDSFSASLIGVMVTSTYEALAGIVAKLAYEI